MDVLSKVLTFYIILNFLTDCRSNLEELDEITSKLKQRLVFPSDSSNQPPQLQTRATELSNTFTYSTTGESRQLMVDDLTDPKELFTHIQVCQNIFFNKYLMNRKFMEKNMCEIKFQILNLEEELQHM